MFFLLSLENKHLNFLTFLFKSSKVPLMQLILSAMNFFIYISILYEILKYPIPLFMIEKLCIPNLQVWNLHQSLNKNIHEFANKNYGKQ